MTAALTRSRGDDQAIARGYTDLWMIEGGCQGGEFLVKPDTDLDGMFRAWGVDWQEWSLVNGSNVLMERITA